MTAVNGSTNKAGQAAGKDGVPVVDLAVGGEQRSSKGG